MKLKCLFVLSAVLLSASAQAAEEEQGALVEKVAVRNRLFGTGARFELGLNLGFGIISQLTEHYTGNLQLSFNIVDTFAIELLGGGSFTRHTSLARDVRDQFAERTVTATTKVDDLSGLWQMLANGVLQLRWQPLYGKIGGVLQDVLAGNPIHFQFYLSAGGGVGYFIRESLVICTHKTGTMCDEFFQESKVGPLFTGALGMRFFLPAVGNHHSLRLEIRDWLYLDSFYTGTLAQSVLNTGDPSQSGGTLTQAGVTQLWQVMIGYSYMF